MIPYNPSSFNSNKTILEQILELKRWLIEHPQYEVYYCNDTALLSPVINSFSLADVPDNTNMDVGDLVVCNNAVYCTVMSVDRDNGVFTAGYGISFKGDTGATGNDGKSIRVSFENYVNDSTAYSRANIQPVHSINEHDIVLFANDYIGYVSTISGINFYVTSTQNIKGDAGANGVSITGVTIDASGHLIVTLSDGNTIDAGSVLSGTGAYVIQLTSYSGTLSADDLAIVNDPTKVCIIDYYVNSEHSFYFKDRQITGGWRFSNLDYVEGSQITIMWYIEIDGTTGSYLQDYSEVFIRAENINSYGATSGQVLMADGSNGASWQTPSTPSVEGTSVLSTGATSGQVLQADGNGGASWQNAGGGGSKYLHIITLKVPYGSGGQNIIIHIINTDSSKYTTADACISAVATFLNSLTTPKKAFCGGYHSTSFSSTNAYNYAQGSSNTSFNSYYNSGASYDQWYTGMSIETFGDSMIAL